MSKKLVLNWPETEVLVDKLVDEIQRRETDIDFVVGIPRGGLVPAVLLSHRLEKPFMEFKDLYHEMPFARKKILLVDDISDTGHTLMKYVDCITATLVVRHTSEFYPDFYAGEIMDDKWVQFAWETDKSPQIQNYLLEK